ncbi:hypothetical protein L6V77_33120 [Myxococcota bacterium]|nr:hypothetical protein [Myxococcota bacterium]
MTAERDPAPTRREAVTALPVGGAALPTFLPCDPFTVIPAPRHRRFSKK